MTDSTSNEMTPLAKLRGLLGYVDDASTTRVTIWIDEQTEEFVLHKGKESGQWSSVFRAKSLKGVIDKAFIDEVSP